MTEGEPKMLSKEQEQAKDILDFLKPQRYDCIDDLPSEKVNKDDPNYFKYKCRRTWWQGINSALGLAKRRKLFKDPEISQRVDNFMGFIMSLSPQNFRTREEIEQANLELDNVIEYLNKEYKY
jgi:hypothetical protein